MAEMAEFMPTERLTARRERSLPLWDALRARMVVERRKVGDGGGGEITIGALPRFECVASAADEATAWPCSCVAIAIAIAIAVA